MTQTQDADHPEAPTPFFPRAEPGPITGSARKSRRGERIEAEHARLLEAAGFRLVRLWPTRSTISLLEATPIP